MDNLDVGRACVVLDLEADLVMLRCALPRRDPGEHPAIWARTAKRLWFKVFQLSTWDIRTSSEVPPMPGQLADELATIGSERQAAIHLLASASVAVSGQGDRREAEAERLYRNVVQFLDTPGGHERKAHINQSLAADLRVRGLEVKGLE